MPAEVIEYTPGVFEDAGSIAISSSAIGPLQRFLPFNFRDLGAGGSLTFASIAGTRDEDLRDQRHGHRRSFNVSATGVVQVVKRETALLRHAAHQHAGRR